MAGTYLPLELLSHYSRMRDIGLSLYIMRIILIFIITLGLLPLSAAALEPLPPPWAVDNICRTGNEPYQIVVEDSFVTSNRSDQILIVSVRNPERSFWEWARSVFSQDLEFPILAVSSSTYELSGCVWSKMRFKPLPQGHEIKLKELVRSVKAGTVGVCEQKISDCVQSGEGIDAHNKNKAT